jgi:hypothetical protein
MEGSVEARLFEVVMAVDEIGVLVPDAAERKGQYGWSLEQDDQGYITG